MSNIIQTTGKHEQNFFLTGEKHQITGKNQCKTGANYWETGADYQNAKEQIFENNEIKSEEKKTV